MISDLCILNTLSSDEVGDDEVFRRRLTFDLSGPPKAGPLEGRVRRHATLAHNLRAERRRFHRVKSILAALQHN